MATATKPTTQAPAPAPQGTAPQTNEAAPKKSRKKGIKYVKLEESAYKPENGKAPANPLDGLAVAVKGGLRFPGVVFENELLGLVVKIPDKAAFIPSPTVRQLFNAIDKLYAQK